MTTTKGYSNPIASVTINIGPLADAVSTQAAQQAAASATAAANSASAAAGSVNTVTTNATNAANSASAAATSASNAASSASAASTSATNAATSASNAATASSNAATSATSASGSAGAASTSASNAATSASNSATSASAAAGSASAASRSALDAATQATNASTFASQASTSASNAATSATSAQTQAGVATAQASNAAQQASIAASAASSALAVYGTSAGLNAAQQVMLGYASTAQSAVSQAQGYAASAASVAQQDLSGITAQAMHRSPNAIVAQCIYDTSRDVDGGAWVDRVNNTSWFNETLNGTWLCGPFSGFQSEMDAREWFGINQSPTTGSLLTGDSSTFTNSVGAWTVSQSCALTNPSGRLRMTQTVVTGNVAIAYIPITTVAGQRYRVDLTYVTSVNGKNTFIGVGTTQTGSTLASLVMSTGTVGSKTISFVATGATTYINFSGSTQWVNGDYAEIDNITCTPVSFATNPSSAFYQDATTGRFQRLWKNRFASPSDFTNTTAWPRNGIASVASRSDGVADLVVADTSTGTHRFTPNNAITGVAQTYTVRAKASGNVQWIFLGGGVGAWFNISNGTLGTVDANSTASIAPAPSGYPGYYDCTLTQTPTATSLNLFLGWTTPTTSYTGDGVSGAYIAQAQIEVGSSFTSWEVPKIGAAATDFGTTQVYRGNTAKFPRLSSIVAESGNVTLYDLTQPGRPMWMQFTASPIYSFISPKTTTGTVSSVAAGYGRLVVATGNTGGFIADFVGDKAVPMRGPGDPTTLQHNQIAYRNSQGGAAYNAGTAGIDYWSLSNGVINAVAIAALPDAPVDPYTGMVVPTVAVATGTAANGINVIRHDGTLVGTAYGGVQNVSFDSRGNVISIGENNCNYRKSWASTGYTTFTTFVGGPLSMGSGGLLPANPASRHFGKLSVVNEGGSTLAFIRDNDAATAAYVAASVSPYFNTGYQYGDARRCWLADASVGTVAATQVIPNSTFDTDTSGWNAVIATVSWNAGTMQIVHANASNAGRAVTSTPVIKAGHAYRVQIDVTQVLGDATGCRFQIGDSNTNLVNTYPSATITGSGAITGTGTIDCVMTVAPGSSTDSAYFGVYVQGGTTAGGGGVCVDNVRVTEVIPDRSVKNQALQISGTITKTAVASAAQLAFYSGFSDDTAYTTELVANGAFNTDASGWVALNGATLSWDSSSGGRLNVTPLNGNNYGAAQQTTAALVSGRMYVLTFDVTSAANTSVQVNGQTVAPVAARSGTGFQYYFTASGTGSAINLIANNTNATPAYFDNVSVRPYNIVGCAANVAQQAYSIDLDFGTGAWSVGAWTSVPNTGYYGPQNLLPYSQCDTGTVAAGTTPPTVASSVMWNGKSASKITFDQSMTAGFSGSRAQRTGYQANITIGTAYASGIKVSLSRALTGSESIVVYFTGTNGTDTQTTINASNSAQYVNAWVLASNNLAKAGATGQFYPVAYVGSTLSSSVDVYLAEGQANVGTVLQPYIATTTTVYNGIAPFFDRSAASGAYIRAGVDGNGALACEAYDGTSVRRVTSPASYATGLATKMRAEYRIDGTLTLKVNGQTVAYSTGNPLLTLSNSAALATVGNARTLDAAFPGSIAHVKVSASTPTQEQSTFMYEQEKFLFLPNAICALPDYVGIADVAYDELQDKVKVVSAQNESTWTGIVCTSTASVGAGSFSKAAHRSGIKALARSGTNPGVDITIPAYGLREELVNRAERAAALARGTVTLDWVGGFTATTTGGANPLTSVSPAVNTWGGSIMPINSTYFGAQISGAGIPAGTTLGSAEVSNTVLRLSANATASGTGVAIAFTDFILPVGYETVDVYVNRSIQQEGATKDYTRLFDGFRETIRFAVAPGATAWVRIDARRTK
jgi:hypothetical protein